MVENPGCHVMKGRDLYQEDVATAEQTKYIHVTDLGRVVHDGTHLVDSEVHHLGFFGLLLLIPGGCGGGGGA